MFNGDLSTLTLDTEYRALKNDPVGQFYLLCLRNARLYRRAVGYFRSTVFAVVGLAVIEFARRGGRIKLICSPDLDLGDVEQIASGYARRSNLVNKSLMDQFDALLADPQTRHGARTLATLIATGTLEIKLAERSDRHGIYHEKLGLFSDEVPNVVSFKGSANETWSGWHSHGNFESIEVFCDWRGGLEAERVRRHCEHFERLWSQQDPDIQVTPFPPSVAAYVQRFASTRLEDLSMEPHTGQSLRVALPHQTSAIESWEAQGRRGILEHATGTGKTFTALLAIRKHIEVGGPALILVPSRLLLEQWVREIRKEFPLSVILLAGNGHERWRMPQRLRSMTAPDAELGPRITLSTMQTASLNEFREQIHAGEHLLLVADEVHQMGSRQNSRTFAIDAGARLGLSATPKRYGDPDGTEHLLAYFEGVVPPPITLANAIATGRLVPYEYHPHPVNLTATEADEWRQETRAIQQELARLKVGADGKRVLNERVKILLIKRARIAKKASMKVRLAVEVVSKAFETGQSWLVYCEDGEQLTNVVIALRDHGLAPIEYHSGMAGDRDATMAWFRAYGGVLVSIRCLDEGVDIPAVSHALILASSQNPRQFIQRRGRVLRLAPGKNLAVIHDAIVVPSNVNKEPEQISLLRAELIRSVEFAKDALNKNAAAELRQIAIAMGLDVTSLAWVEGQEDDE